LNWFLFEEGKAQAGQDLWKNLLHNPKK
jgi:hypothetical protein